MCLSREEGVPLHGNGMVVLAGLGLSQCQACRHEGCRGAELGVAISPVLSLFLIPAPLQCTLCPMCHLHFPWDSRTVGARIPLSCFGAQPSCMWLAIPLPTKALAHEVTP